MRFLLSAATLCAAAFLLSAADTPGKEVIFIGSQQVNAGFAKGGTLLNKGAYQILTSHRVQPGEVEVHNLDTDIMYVIEGSATIVTGGTVVDGRTTAPNEIRGKSINGGQTHHLTKGDILVVPEGVPHWYKQIDNKLVNYYVVKVRTGK